MRTPNANFSQDPLLLACYYDPREDFYNAGYAEYGVQWSFDHDSTLAALRAFLYGTQTYVDTKSPVREILSKPPHVRVEFYKRSYGSLIRECEKLGRSSLDVLRETLGVEKLEIIAL